MSDDPAIPTFDVTPFLHRDEGQHFDRKSMLEGPPGKKVARKRRAIRDQVAQYVAAFANAEGGVLILGLEDDGEVTGHELPPEATSSLLNTPRERLDPPQAAGVEVEHSGRKVLVFEVAVSFVPVQVVGDGFPLRMADQTVQASPDQIKALKFAGLAESFEARPSTATLEELDTDLIDAAKANAGLAELSRADYLVRRRLADWKGPSLVLRQAAELLFASGVVAHPNAGVRVFHVVGTERRTGAQHNVEELPRVEGALPAVLADAETAIAGRIRRPSRLGVDAVFRPVPEYPDFAWREALLNAVAHRDYGVQGRGVEVWLFDDRMEVTSPGGLLPSVSIDRLLAGERTHVSRNPRTVRCLVDLGLMRDAGEGILRMYETMREQRLPMPRYDTREHDVWVTLRNREPADGGGLDTDRGMLGADRGMLGADRGMLDADRGMLDADRGELTDTERQLIAALGERPRVDKLRVVILALLRRRVLRPADIAAALGRSDVHKLSERHLSPMVEGGLIKRTIPDKPTDPNQAYYAAEGYQGPPVATGSR